MPNMYLGVLQYIPGAFRRLSFLPSVSKVYSLKDIELVPNLATRACGGTVVYARSSRLKFKGGLFFTPCHQSSKLKDI